METETKTTTKEDLHFYQKKSFLIITISTILILIAGIWGYKKIFIYPAVIIDFKHIISSDELKENLDDMISFYENQDFASIGMRVDFATEEGKQRKKIIERQLLGKMIEDKAIEVLAKKEGIVITQEQADVILERKFEEYGTKEVVVEDIGKKYGWNLEDFRRKVVVPSLLREGLEEATYDKISNEKPQEKVNLASAELKKGVSFAEVAKTFSEGSSAEKDGELGWVNKKSMVPEVASYVFSNKASGPSEIIESSLGYHIVEVIEKKKEGESDMAKIRQIFVRKNNFAQWLQSQMREMNIYIPLEDYYWNESSLIVEFQSEQLRNIEKEMRKKGEGDPTLLF